MAFIPTTNGVSVVFEGIQNGIPIVNKFHLNVGTSPDVTLLEDVLDVFQTWMAAYWLQLAHTSYTLARIVAKDISVADGEEAALNLTSGNVGLNTGLAMAANAAVVLSWRTIKTGRSFRGRTYMGGMPNSFLADAQNINSSVAVDIAEAGQALLDAITAAGYTLCVLSKYALKVARIAGLLTEIIGLVVDTKVDSQRRRTAN